MLIECKLRRDGGTKVTIDGTLYDFRPNEDGKHICDVSNKRHIVRFLSIDEAYAEHELESEPLPQNLAETSEKPRTRGRPKKQLKG